MGKVNYIVFQKCDGGKPARGQQGHGWVTGLHSVPPGKNQFMKIKCILHLLALYKYSLLMEI